MIIKGVCAEKQKEMPLPCFAANSLANGRASLATWHRARLELPCYPILYTCRSTEVGTATLKKKSCNLYICLVLFWSRKNIVEILCVVSPLGEKNATKGAPLPLFSIFSPDIADEFLLTNNHTFWCLNVWVLVMFGSPAVGFLCRRTKHVNLVPTLQGGSRSNFISYCKEITLKSGRRSRVVVF